MKKTNKLFVILILALFVSICGSYDGFSNEVNATTKTKVQKTYYKNKKLKKYKKYYYNNKKLYKLDNRTYYNNGKLKTRILSKYSLKTRKISSSSRTNKNKKGRTLSVTTLYYKNGKRYKKSYIQYVNGVKKTRKIYNKKNKLTSINYWYHGKWNKKKYVNTNYKAKYYYKVFIVSNYGRAITGSKIMIYIKTNNPNPKRMKLVLNKKNGMSDVMQFRYNIPYADINHNKFVDNGTRFTKVPGGYITDFELGETYNHTIELWETASAKATDNLINYFGFISSSSHKVAKKVVNKKIKSYNPGVNDPLSEKWIDNLMKKITKPSMNTIQKLSALNNWIFDNARYPTNDGNRNLVFLFKEIARPNDYITLDSIDAPSLMHYVARKLGVPEKNIVRGSHRTDGVSDVHHSQIKITANGVTHTFSPTPFTETGSININKVKQFDFSIYK